MREGIYRIELEPKEANATGVAFVAEEKIEGILGGKLYAGSFSLKRGRLHAEINVYAYRADQKLSISLNNLCDFAAAEYDDGFLLSGEFDSYRNIEIAVRGTWIAELNDRAQNAHNLA